ncbi:MAG: DPP IV N-terminal domain-containing protein, partial [Muribaculaceae bacterium]|nr:DPP IV N-terminal domain-containing protein [Muribaculaceae bacterium]
MNIGKILVVSAIAVGVSFNLQALTIEDYVSPAHNAPKGIKDMRPMADGLTYSAISDDGSSIDVFDYKTGKKVNTIFSISTIKGDVKIDSFDGYSISENEKKILLWNDVNKIYRHSFSAQYFVYDVIRGTIKRVSTGGAQRGAVLSHDGRMVAYTRDNNIYISNLDYDTDKSITTDGELNKIINGVSDWSYEEEFGVISTMRWSGDDTSLAYMKFDESDVPTYSFDNYKSFCDADPLSDIYPKSYSYKYPLAGYPNVKVSVHVYNIDNRTTKKMDLPVADYIPSFEYDGTGTNLMVMQLNRDQNHLELFKVNPGSTVARSILEERNNSWLNPSAYQMVSYGKDSFVIGSERSGHCHLYEYDYNGSLLKQITKGEWNVTDYYGKSPKLGTYYFQSTIKGAINRNVCSVDAKGSVAILNDMDGFESASFSKSMDYYVRTFSTATVPTVYSLCNSKGGVIKELENNAAYA